MPTQASGQNVPGCKRPGQQLLFGFTIRPFGRSSNKTMTETNHYDLIVIGSGPAGEKGAAQAAYFGKRVALIEKEPVLGGAAANTGTLPSKTLRETALFLSGFRQREFFGLDLDFKKKVNVSD